MTSFDLDISIRHTFIILHALFIAGAAGYIYLEQNQIAMFFAVSSAISLIYYVLFQNRALINRLQAHLNLIDQAVQDSEEFREGVKKKSEASKEAETINLTDILAEKNVEEAEEFIDTRLDEEDYGDYGNVRSFLEAVKEAEEEGLDRLGVKNYANEKIIEELGGGEQ